MDQRAKNVYLLGTSLANLFDIASIAEFLRALIKLLDEWEAVIEGNKGVVGPPEALLTPDEPLSWAEEKGSDVNLRRIDGIRGGHVIVEPSNGASPLDCAEKSPLRQTFSSPTRSSATLCEMCIKRSSG